MLSMFARCNLSSLVLQHSLKTITRKLPTSVRTPFTRNAKAVVPATAVPPQKKPKQNQTHPHPKKKPKNPPNLRINKQNSNPTTRLKTSFVPATAWLPFLNLLHLTELKSENKGGIRSSHKNTHLHSFLKVKDKVIFSWLSLKLWSSQPTIKNVFPWWIFPPTEADTF